MKNKSILLVIAILLVGLSRVGGTYAYLTMTASVTNGNYNTTTTCFNIDYNISNEGSGQDITGTLFPSSGPNSGLSGRVGLKVNSSCSTNGIGTLKLHINSTTSSSLMTSASSYCQDRKTLEPISGITTESACTTAGGRWRGYGDAYCENTVTLQRMTEYTTQNDCTNNDGIWKSGGSPLKYAVYDNSNATGVPLSKGYITSTDINTDKTIYDNFIIDSNQAYYYIFIWIDGYLVDNAVNDLPFSGYVKASADQANIRYTYTANLYDDNAQEYNYVWIGQAIPNTITEYTTPDAAMAALKAAGGGTTDYPFFLKHIVGNYSGYCAYEKANGIDTGIHYCLSGMTTQSECNNYFSGWDWEDNGTNYTYVCTQTSQNNAVTDSYLGFVVTSQMASNNPGMTAGTYYLKGGDNGRSFLANAKIIYDAFGGINCSGDNNMPVAYDPTYTPNPSSFFHCDVSGLNVYAYSYGYVSAHVGNSAICYVHNGDGGYSLCQVIVGGGG